jgi:hypothetical protein
MESVLNLTVKMADMANGNEVLTLTQVFPLPRPEKVQ